MLSEQLDKARRTIRVPPEELAEAMERVSVVDGMIGDLAGIIICADSPTDGERVILGTLRGTDIRTVLQALRQQQAAPPEADPALVAAVRRLLGGEPWSGIVDAAWALGARSICTPDEEDDNQVIMDADNDQLEAAIRQVLRERGDSDGNAE